MPGQRDLWDTIQRAVAQGRARTHTAMPAVVTAVNAAAGTVDVQLPAQMLVNDEPISYPVIPGVPMVWPGGGSTYTAHPVAVGDSVLLIAAERSTDGWWLGQDDIPPTDRRRHDWSDCFAVPVVRRSGAQVPIPAQPTVAGDEVHLGAPAPADAVAVGSATQSGLDDLASSMGDFLAAVRPLAVALDGLVPGVLTAFDLATADIPPVIAPVSSIVVKIPGGAE